MNRDAIISLVAEASQAPNVHNVQPARWRILDDGLILYEDLNVRLRAADPDGNDAAMSLGAALEGLALAASNIGLSVVAHENALPAPTENLRPVVALKFEEGKKPDPLAEIVERRQSWRGMFETPTAADRETVRSLQSEECAVFAEPAQLAALAELVEDASFSFMRDAPFRVELLSWMRLSRRHERWALDGLNASAMKLGKMEALGAGLVLGPAFSLLDRIGLAKGLLAETDKTKSASGVLVFHRPSEESPLESGRHFYRLWLRIEAAGFGAAVLAALADSPQASAEIARQADVSSDRRIVSAFRVGRRLEDEGYRRARLPVTDLLV